MVEEKKKGPEMQSGQEGGLIEKNEPMGTIGFN